MSIKELQRLLFSLYNVIINVLKIYKSTDSFPGF